MVTVSIPNRFVRPFLFLATLALVSPLVGCGKDDNPGGPGGSAQSAIVRWELTPSTRSTMTIANVPATFHSFEDAGSCTLVVYDIDDEVYGVPSYVQFLIPSAVCLGTLDGQVEGYSFSGLINEALGSVEELVSGQEPFATGFYWRDDDPMQTGTFEFFVDQLTG